MNDIKPVSIPSPSVAPRKEVSKQEHIFEKAQEFEAVFVAQMLNYSGLTKAVSSNGGFGGEAFSNMLVEQYARKIVDNGGFGLAEHIYEQLLEKEVNDGTTTTA